MGTITSANAQVMLNVPGVFPTPVQLAGFAADDAFTQDAYDVAETRMGVDGVLSAGFTRPAAAMDASSWAVTNVPL